MFRLSKAPVGLCSCLLLALLAGCASQRLGVLTVTGGEPVTYQCQNGESIVARYYALSDDSLNFVKVTMPDGQEVTLPNAMSASGARYTDDRQLVWWTKGDSAFSEARDGTGQWQTQYEDCQVVAEK